MAKVRATCIAAVAIASASAAGGCSSVASGAPLTIRHRGPTVHFDESGPARFVPPLLEAFDTSRAMETVTFVDEYYRAPANEGYERVIDRLVERLRAAGFGVDAGLELRVESSAMDAPAWTPRSAALVLSVDGVRETLHAFVEDGDVDRVMLPINAPSCSVSGPIAFGLADLDEGEILVTDVALSQVMNRARQHRAAAVVSASLGSFNVDPSGQGRHLDAIQFTTVEADPKIPVAQISARSLERIRAVAQTGAEIRLSLDAKAELEVRPLRTVIAEIVGRTRPDEAVAMASHVQEPGACDNASGVAGLLECAEILAEMMQRDELAWPSRTIAFLWGDEFEQSRVWLDSTKRRPVAGFSSDMTGQSRTRTGAIALVERMPDPGALVTIPPDEHTPWGAGEVSEEELSPNGLAVVARCSLNDVGRSSGGWESADHPWEGGSDHDVFIGRGIPAVLFWHFTDFAYHTSLDRLDMVDPEEMRRTQVALISTALAVADPGPDDAERYHACIAMEEEQRELAAESAGRSDIAKLWKEWSVGAHEWVDRELRP